MISRLLKIIRFFCKTAMSKRLYFAKESCNFIDPTNRSHPINSHATFYNTQQREKHCNTLQDTTAHCNTVQPYNTLQHPAAPCNTLQHNVWQDNILDSNCKCICIAFGVFFMHSQISIVVLVLWVSFDTFHWKEIHKIEIGVWVWITLQKPRAVSSYQPNMGWQQWQHQ